MAIDFHYKYLNGAEQSRRDELAIFPRRVCPDAEEVELIKARRAGLFTEPGAGNGISTKGEQS